MKMCCLSENIETAVGMKLAGIDSIVIENKKDADLQIDKILKDINVGILIVTEKVYEMSQEKLDEIKKNRKMPLLVYL